MSSGASNPTPPPVSAAVSPPGAHFFTKGRLALAAGVVALGIGVVIWQTRGPAVADAPLETADTPRVDGERITFSNAFVERAKLKFSPVSRALLVPVVTAVGTVDFNPEYVAAVGTRLKGLVSRVAKFEGDTVESGALLAVIESGELGEAQAAVSMLEAEKRAADAEPPARKDARAEEPHHPTRSGGGRRRSGALSAAFGSREAEGCRAFRWCR